MDRNLVSNMANASFETAATQIRIRDSSFASKVGSTKQHSSRNNAEESRTAAGQNVQNERRLSDYELRAKLGINFQPIWTTPPSKATIISGPKETLNLAETLTSNRCGSASDLVCSAQIVQKMVVVRASKLVVNQLKLLRSCFGLSCCNSNKIFA